ncbi:hypothetical protein KO493_14535 [Tamlana agarivorans]|uniref:Uncharacterized protein n=1 Tax=Pseudotamlana agarivorans TaxID=481183 RepID=A0ACC5UC96_9FLAO|nr:hypothetical protein [Tamlana agarivorans]MBU2951914.1 hypothetical protein [Tamlana agarivorans]
MKNTVKNIGVLFFFMGLFASFTTQAQSSCSSDYYPLDKGTVYELTHYDKKGKVDWITKNEVTATTSSTATVHTVQTSSDGEEKINASYTVKCEANGIAMDLNQIISEQIAANMTNPDIKMEMSGTDVIVPNDLKVGQTLPDSELNLDIIAPSTTINCHVETSERKVIGEESVTTPAGTFDCVVMTQKTDIKMLVSKHTNSKIWLSKGVGVVKQETYNKKGKLQGRDVLTSFKK